MPAIRRPEPDYRSFKTDSTRLTAFIVYEVSRLVLFGILVSSGYLGFNYFL